MFSPKKIQKNNVNFSIFFVTNDNEHGLISKINDIEFHQKN